jgi:hypothetical protein
MILKASTMSRNMSAIGSSTIAPLLAKPTRLAYVYPSTATAAHDVSISSHRITLSALVPVHRATLPTFGDGLICGLPDVPHIAKSCQIEQLC